MQRVLILGAGFGWLELATRLSEEVPDAAEVTLIDQSGSFVFGFSKLDVMFGREKPEAVHMYYRDIVKPSVEFRQETIRSIDPVAKRVVTDRATYDTDILVVALGADIAPEVTPGIVEAATSSTPSPARSECAISSRRSRRATRSSACSVPSTSARPRPTRPR